VSIMTDDWCDRLHANQTESGVCIVTNGLSGRSIGGGGGIAPARRPEKYF